MNLTMTYRVTLHWLGGRTSEGMGEGGSRTDAAADAMRKMGYGAGALAALDYWEAQLAESDA